MLEQKADKLRKELGSPAAALGMDDAVKEIKEISRTMKKRSLYQINFLFLDRKEISMFVKQLLLV